MNFEIKPDIEPKDKYEKARKSLLEALDDFRKLDNYQKEKLFKEIFTAEMYIQAISTLKQFNNSNIK